MAKKRVFTNKRGGALPGSRKKRSLSLPEIDDRPRGTGARKQSASGPSRTSDARKPRESTRRPGERSRRPAASSRKAGKSARQSTRARKTDERRPPRRPAGKVNTFRLGLIGAGVLVVVILMVWLIFIRPSPIGAVTPTPGKLAPGNCEVKVKFSGQVKKGSATLTVDGKDVSGQVAITGKQISYKSALADGKHTALVTYNAGGLTGKRSKQWAFTVDSVPPKLALTTRNIVDLKKGNQVRIDVAGQTDKDSTVKLGTAELKVDPKGNFKGSANTDRSKSVEIAAFDPAGNKTGSYIVTQKPVDAKGAHVSIYIAAGDSDLGKLIDLVGRTELNALQIDLKDEAGQIGFAIDNALAKQDGARNDLIKLDATVDRLRYKDIYSICRIVVMKDPKLAKARPDLVVKDSGTGKAWGQGFWMDPYSKEVWDYNVSVAEAAAKAGFNEIQFDYMRFPSDGGNTATCVFPHQDARTHVEAIDGFVSYAREKLAPYNVFISTDLFGLTASSQGEMGIGQKVEDIAKRVDFISPMVYPSHYNPGEYNIKSPENAPHDTVAKSLDEFKKKMQGTPALLRPWLQDFSLHVPYTADMVKAQINACTEAGVTQWLLWDPDCTYSEAALKPQK